MIIFFNTLNLFVAGLLLYTTTATSKYVKSILILIISVHLCVVVTLGTFYFHTRKRDIKFFFLFFCRNKQQILMIISND